VNEPLVDQKSANGSSILSQISSARNCAASKRVLSTPVTPPLN